MARRNVAAPGASSSTADAAAVPFADQTTDYARWRLRDDRGTHTWHYLETDADVAAWPQTTADKYFLGLDLGLPSLARALRPLDAARNGLAFAAAVQLPPGNWGCEYGGPMFLLPGLVVTWYVTGTAVPAAVRVEIKNYLFARQHAVDAGWGLHAEGDSSVFGTALNYTALRLVGVAADDARLVRARALLHAMGGALYAPHWAKFWLSVLGVASWDLVNPVPPELWLLPDWVPIAPWRWWIHIRQVFLPMSFIWSRRWSHPLDHLTRQLRSELYSQPYESIDFAAHRNSISPRDNYHPKTWIVELLFLLFLYVWMPFLRTAALVRRAEDWVWWLIQAEDANTDFANLGPVNAPMNTLCCYIQEGPDAHSFREHQKTLLAFLWMKHEGMLMNGTDGVQVWDTSFMIQSAVSAGVAEDAAFRPMLTQALDFLADQQIRAECANQAACYRHARKGAWGFSTRKQGYTVSDCTSEALKAVLALQALPGYPTLISRARIREAVDVLLTMQNPSGGCASYEPARGSELLEHLNVAEVFGRIMVEYDYPECTTAVLTALAAFARFDPSYRAHEIAAFRARALDYIRAAQRPDGSWYGSWGICFTYATMFACEALASAGESHAASARARRACAFLLDRQNPDGGWGESYRSCETGVYCPHQDSQVVQTAWALISLLELDYPEVEPLRNAVRLLMRRQQPSGEWKQEAMEGVFNKSCMISFPNYKFIFPIRALSLFAQRWGNDAMAG